MIFKPLYLFSNQETGKDVLGNSINELVQIGETTGIFSDWSAKEVALDDRNITVNNRKIVTRESKANLIQAQKVNFEGLYHNITAIKGDDSQRWRLLVVNRYGSETP